MPRCRPATCARSSQRATPCAATPHPNRLRGVAEGKFASSFLDLNRERARYCGVPTHSLAQRARAHAALGDPVRLAIVEHLVASDRTSNELQKYSGVAPNLLAYHLD